MNPKKAKENFIIYIKALPLAGMIISICLLIFFFLIKGVNKDDRLIVFLYSILPFILNTIVSLIYRFVGKIEYW